MPIIDLYLDLNEEYTKLLKDTYKICIILIIFHILVNNLNTSNNIINSALTGCLMNDEFMTLLFIALISVSAYYLIFDKILCIH